MANHYRTKAEATPAPQAQAPSQRGRLEAFSIKEGKEGGKGFWTKIGIAWENKDGSYNLFLDCLPVDGKVHLRAPSERPASDAKPPF